MYISTFISGALYIFRSLEIQFSMCQLPKSAFVIFFPPSISYGVHQIWATRKDGTIGSFILFHVNWKRKGLATAFGHSRSFTAALIGAKLDFPVFLRSERRKTGNCSFTAALIGGKLDFPVFLRSERRKTGNCSFTAAPIGGKVDFPVFLLPEGRKTANCMWRKSFNPIFYPFFPSFACWWVVGRGLAPQNEGWTCVNNNWEK